MGERGTLIRQLLSQAASGQGPGITVRHEVPGAKVPWGPIIIGSAILVSAVVALKGK
jgi:hypothetical protein